MPQNERQVRDGILRRKEGIYVMFQKFAPDAIGRLQDMLQAATRRLDFFARRSLGRTGTPLLCTERVVW